MSDRRSTGTMMVSAPRVSDAVGSALRNAFRPCDCANEWETYLRRIDRADRNRRD